MWEISWIFPLLLGLIVLGLPIGIALFASALAILLTHGLETMSIAHIMYATLDSFVLSALPLFILMANVLYRAKIGDQLFDLLRRVLEVVVHDDTEVAGRMVETRHDGVVFPEVPCEPDVGDPVRMRLVEAPANVVGAVAAPVVHEDDLQTMRGSVEVHERRAEGGDRCF